jgi:hypothetical protein
VRHIFFCLLSFLNVRDKCGKVVVSCNDRFRGSVWCFLRGVVVLRSALSVVRPVDFSKRGQGSAVVFEGSRGFSNGGLSVTIPTSSRSKR